MDVAFQIVRVKRIEEVSKNDLLVDRFQKHQNIFKDIKVNARPRIELLEDVK